MACKPAERRKISNGEIGEIPLVKVQHLRALNFAMEWITIVMALETKIALVLRVNHESVGVNFCEHRA